MAWGSGEGKESEGGGGALPGRPAPPEGRLRRNTAAPRPAEPGPSWSPGLPQGLGLRAAAVREPRVPHARLADAVAGSALGSPGKARSLKVCLNHTFDHCIYEITFPVSQTSFRLSSFFFIIFEIFLGGCFPPHLP